MRKFPQKFPRMLWCLVFILFFSSHAWGMSQELVGRMGLGFSNELVNGIPTFSIKMQRSSAFAFGALIGFKNSDQNGGLGAGLRFYRILFDEPLLNFFAAGTAAMISAKTADSATSGFQFDFTLGSEFHFTGLESLGFSIEFGFSVNKLYDQFTLETVGRHMLQAGIHFYL